MGWSGHMDFSTKLKPPGQSKLLLMNNSCSQIRVMSLGVLNAANQTDGCKSLSYLILLSTSLVSKPNQQRKGFVTKAGILVLKLRNFRWRINKCFVLKDCKLLAEKFKYFYLLLPIIFNLTTQTHFCKNGRVWWNVYISCVLSHCTVQYNHIAHMLLYMTVWVAIAV